MKREVNKTHAQEWEVVLQPKPLARGAQVKPVEVQQALMWRCNKRNLMPAQRDWACGVRGHSVAKGAQLACVEKHLALCPGIEEAGRHLHD